jgi:hypothetical protein
MFAKVKSTTFIDSFQLEFAHPSGRAIHAVLRDDQGCVCSILEEPGTLISNEPVEWKGLNNLPYGVYTLEVTQGEDEMKLKMVKRV